MTSPHQASLDARMAVSTAARDRNRAKVTPGARAAAVNPSAAGGSASSWDGGDRLVAAQTKNRAVAAPVKPDSQADATSVLALIHESGLAGFERRDA